MGHETSSPVGTGMHAAFRNTSQHHATLEPITSPTTTNENGNRSVKGVFSSLAASFSGKSLMHFYQYI
jgi:hypothetical protein